MATIEFTIDNAYLDRATEAMKGLYPIPSDANGDPTFTDNQWGKECMRSFLVRSVKRWETKVAKDAVVVDDGDDLIT